MVLPPLELFSLRKELPSCRAALSVFMGLFPDWALMEGAPADVGQHGAANDERGNRECRQKANPEADAAERDEQRTLMASEREARLVRHERADGHGEEKSRSPNDGDPECKLDGLIHGCSPSAQETAAVAQAAFGPFALNFTEVEHNDTIV